MKKLNIRDLELKGKRVLVRVDFNVPQDKKTFAIKDDSRIVGALPTINYLIDHGAKVILMSHLGRPEGQVNTQFSLKPVADKLSELLKKPVQFAADCIGPETLKLSQELKEGQVLLLENLRFHAEEEKNDPAFAKQLAELGDLYVNDAFGTAHRAHASTEGVTKYFKQNAAGFLMEKEIDYLSAALEKPEHPFVAILGGAKVSDKIAVIENLIPKAESILIGGAMAYTFLLAQGKEVGSSLVEKDKLDMAKEILEKSQEIKFLLPSDHIAAEKKEGEPDKKGKPTFYLCQSQRGHGNSQRHGRGGHRPQDHCRVFQSHCRGQDRGLERSDGHLREPRNTPRGHSRSPRRWRPPGPNPSWAAGTRPRPCTFPGWRTRSATSPPGAGPSWSSWRGKCCPAWRR